MRVERHRSKLRKEIHEQGRRIRTLEKALREARQRIDNALLALRDDHPPQYAVHEIREALKALSGDVEEASPITDEVPPDAWAVTRRTGVVVEGHKVKLDAGWYVAIPENVIGSGGLEEGECVMVEFVGNKHFVGPLKP